MQVETARAERTAVAPAQANATESSAGSVESATGLYLAWDADAPDAQPERQLAQLAGAFGPLRRALAAISERLIDSRAPARLCYARLSDYARERPGVSARQLQELARVHRALLALPVLERALVENELPWSKVRLIARVASAEDEACWISRAKDVSVRRLEEEIRQIDGKPEPIDLADAVPTARVGLRCTPAVSEKWHVTKEFAECVAGRRLLAGEVLELAAAEVFSAISIGREIAIDTETDPRIDSLSQPEPDDLEPSMPPEFAPMPARDLPAAISSLMTGLAEADAFELDRRLRNAIRLEQSLDAAIAPLLRIVTSSEHEWSGDYRTLASYTTEQLGMSPAKARALLRLERAGDVCPELRAAYRSGQVSWVKAQCLLPLLLLDIPGSWRPVWLTWAQRVTLRRLERDVERALLLRARNARAWARCESNPERAQDPIPSDERQMCAHDADLDATRRLTWRVPRDVASLFRAVNDTLMSRCRVETGRALSDGEAFEALLDIALLSWTLQAPGARRPDPVIERDGYRCAVPGCTSRGNLHDHHVKFRSRGGSDELDNRITLCVFHHQHCLHAGLLRVTGTAPDGLVFEIALRDRGSPLLRYRSGDITEASQHHEGMVSASGDLRVREHEGWCLHAGGDF